MKRVVEEPAAIPEPANDCRNRAQVRQQFSCSADSGVAAGGSDSPGCCWCIPPTLPQVTELEKYRPSTITELYDDQNRVIGQFALQRRVIDKYDDFPKVLRDALISTEDKDFERHWGVDVWRVFGAA